MLLIIHDNQTTKWHNPKGNISLIMLFVLAIAALMGLMSSHFLQSMIRETSAMRNNYQAYYLAKAGIELWTLAVNSYDYGFTDTLSGWSDIFQKNILCTKGPCTIDLSIQSVVTGWLIGKDIHTIDNCTPEHAIALSSWSSLILPLFIDTRKLHTTQNDTYFKNIITSYKMSIIPIFGKWWSLGIGIVLWSGSRKTYDDQDSESMQQLYMTHDFSEGSFNIEDILTYNKNLLWSDLAGPTIAWLLSQENFKESEWLFNYLAITNINEDNSTLWFCLNFEANNTTQYPLDTSIVSSTASYRDTSLSLQGIIKKELADYVYSSYQWN